MKTLLLCPGIRPAVPQLARTGPLATAPILGENLVVHWVERVASLGARQVIVLAPDRADQVRTALGDGSRWGVRLEVQAPAHEPTVAEAAASHRPAGEPGWLPAPHDVVVLSHLPGCPEFPLFENYAGWFAALIAWMPQALTPARVRVREVQPGIWLGRRARVSPRAQLLAPCWIGDHVWVGPEATIGPGAILEDRAVVEAGARITQSIVGPDTLVGRMTAVANSLAAGSTLTNWRNDSSLLVPDPFLLSSLNPPPGPSAGRLSRSLGALARKIAAPFAPSGTWQPPLEGRTDGFKPPL